MASLFRRKPAATVAVAPAEPPPPPPPEEEEPPIELEAQELPFQEPPIDQAAADGDEFTGARLRRVREQLTAADVERRIASCVDTLLGAAELPVNPFPPLAKLLRREELAVELGQPHGTKPSDAAPHGKRARANLWREGELVSSQADSQLALLPRMGAAWKPLAGIIDSEAVSALAAGLEPTQLLAGTARAVNTPSGTFTVKTCCSITGAHAFAGRVLAHARTVELREYVQVRGPGSRLDAAVGAFAEYVCASALKLHATKEHFVQELEVYTGDGDAFDEEATAEVNDGRATSNARGTPERFGLIELHARAPVIARALQAAALAQLPVYLHVVVCIPVSEPPAPGGGSSNAAPTPPRWQFVAVQKRLCFFYESTLPSSKTAGSRGAAAAAAAAASEQQSAPRFQPLQLQGLFQSVWLSDVEASWHNGLRENKVDPTGGGSSFLDARESWMAFMRSQLCKFLMKGDHFNLLEALLLLLPETARAEREPLLAEIRACYTSHAGLLADLSHQCNVVQRALLAAESAATPAPKRAFAHGVARRQCQHIADSLKDFCARAKWADIEPVETHLLEAARVMFDEGGRLRVDADAQRNLRRLRRILQALHQTLSDTLISVQPNIRAAVGKVWGMNAGVEVPVSLQAPAMRVKVVDVEIERERARKTKTYPAALAREAVLMQYVVDTQLDRCLSASLEDVCTARVLKGNPLHAILLRVKAAAQYFELWRETDGEVRAGLLQTSGLTLADIRRNIYSKKASGGEKTPLYISSTARWGDLSGGTGLSDVAPRQNRGGGDRDGLAIYGVRPSLLFADHQQLHDLRGQLAELMPMRTTTVAQRFESTVNTAFTGDMLVQGSFSDLDSVHAVEVREDHFIRGRGQQEVLAIHCQHVVQSCVRVHQKTRHLVSALVFGHAGARWSIGQVLQNQREALAEAMATAKRGHPILFHAYALVRGQGGQQRYVQLIKEHHLCSISPPTADGKGGEVQSWPARTTQLFDSVFLSLQHAQSCLEAESTTVGDPLRGWRARKWAATLTERAKSSYRGGHHVSACTALLLRGLLLEPGSEHEITILPTVGRLLTSTAARLHSLAHLCRAIQGVLECTRSEENKVKIDNKACVRMFHAYRAPILEFLASDACCSFEAMRVTIQEAIYGVLTDLRSNGVLTGDANPVLETIEDYACLVEISVAEQVVHNDSRLLAALKESLVTRPASAV